MELSQKAAAYLQQPKAANTLRAYGNDWKNFSAWCVNHNVNSLPAAAPDVANYLSDIAERVCANTVARHLTAISIYHKMHGYSIQNPAQEGVVKTLIYSIKRQNGTRQQGKMPITPQMLQAFDFSADIIGKRDKALLLVGFAGALRRSELVNLTVNDLQFCGEGVVITIQHSKTDQYGEGQKIAIPYAPDKNKCPVTALTNWLTAAKIKSGYVFRAFWRGSQAIKGGKMTDRTVALIVKKYAESAGMNPEQYSGHSLRRGFATAAARAEVDTFGIMRQTRHKSILMVNKYISEGNAFKQNALNKIWSN